MKYFLIGIVLISSTVIISNITNKFIPNKFYVYRDTICPVNITTPEKVYSIQNNIICEYQHQVKFLTFINFIWDIFINYSPLVFIIIHIITKSDTMLLLTILIFTLNVILNCINQIGLNSLIIINIKAIVTNQEPFTLFSKELYYNSTRFGIDFYYSQFQLYLIGFITLPCLIFMASGFIMLICFIHFYLNKLGIC